MGQPAEDAGFIIASKHRTAVALRLDASPAIPKAIKTDTGRPYSRVSDALEQLREEGLVELLVPEERSKGRLYGLTDRGDEAVQYMRDTNMIDD